MTEESLLNGAPIGSIAACTTSGWTDPDCFVIWLRHFIQLVNPSKDRRHVLIFDGHCSHKSLEALEMALENGVDIITLPPHCTHRLQPLDVGWFKSLKANYNTQADSWLRSNLGRRITDFEVAGIFANAYGLCTASGKMEKAFSTCGLWPINPDVFTDDDFAAARMTEEPEPAAEDNDGSHGPAGSSQLSSSYSSQPGGGANSGSVCSGRPQEPTCSCQSGGASSGSVCSGRPQEPTCRSQVGGGASSGSVCSGRPQEPTCSCQSGGASSGSVCSGRPQEPTCSCQAGGASSGSVCSGRPQEPTCTCQAGGASSGSVCSGRSQQPNLHLPVRRRQLRIRQQRPASGAFLQQSGRRRRQPTDRHSCRHHRAVMLHTNGAKAGPHSGC